jgi:maltooligosyltrehalose trehalohydrolase
MRMRVWAPLANAVDLVAGEQRIGMQHRGGYWSVEIDASIVAEGYRYSVDGGHPLPDPRSRWQPEGVHGPSFLLDVEELRRIHHSSFQPKALRHAVIYELHIGTFTAEGTYPAAQGKLDHLVALGVTHVELMPLATFPGGHGWGYDGVDLYAPQPSYGTPQELARFVRACHDRGLAVLLDVVYNHVGPDGNYLAHFGPYFTDRVKTPWGEAINYDGALSDGVRRFVIDNALMWLEDYGFDGLRLDAVHAICSFEAVHVLEELADEVRELGRAARQGPRLDRRERSQRSAPGAFGGARRLWAERALGRRLSSRRAPILHRRAGRVLCGLQWIARCRDGPRARLRVSGSVLRLSAAAAWPTAARRSV